MQWFEKDEKKQAFFKFPDEVLTIRLIPLTKTSKLVQSSAFKANSKPNNIHIKTFLIAIFEHRVFDMKIHWYFFRNWLILPDPKTYTLLPTILPLLFHTCLLLFASINFLLEAEIAMSTGN